MKKYAPSPLLMVVLVFISLICGIFLGRISNTYNAIPPREESQSDFPSNQLSNQLYVDGKLNLNIATAQNLMLVPGIGETTANRIITYRMEHGYFIEMPDLLKVEGIGEKMLENIRDYVTVGE